MQNEQEEICIICTAIRSWILGWRCRWWSCGAVLGVSLGVGLFGLEGVGEWMCAVMRRWMLDSGILLVASSG